jgi:uncharacterized protein YbjQ (UPF0145 family)
MRSVLTATTPTIAEREIAQTLGADNGMLMVTASGAAVKLR